MRTISRCLILTLVTLGAACAQSPEDSQLASARKRWSDHPVATYSFTWQQGCECLFDMRRPIQITAAAGQIQSAVFVDDGRAVDEQVRRYLTTIEGVFDKIQAALDQNADQVTVAYDPTLGYPTSVFLDYSMQVADEEFALQISDFTAVAP